MPPDCQAFIWGAIFFRADNAAAAWCIADLRAGKFMAYPSSRYCPANGADVKINSRNRPAAWAAEIGLRHGRLR